MCPFSVLHIKPPSQSTAPVELQQVPLGQAPFLHHLRSPVVPIPSELQELCSTASQVLLACPPARKCTRRDFGLGLPRPDCLRDYTTAASELSRFPLMERMHMPQVSDSGELSKHSHIAPIHVAFPIVQQGRHSRTVISELNTAPMHTPTNASPRHHWSSRHSSGPERIATPFSVEDSALKPHLLLHAGFNRRFLDVPFLYFSYSD